MAATWTRSSPSSTRTLARCHTRNGPTRAPLAPGRPRTTASPRDAPPPHVDPFPRVAFIFLTFVPVDLTGEEARAGGRRQVRPRGACIAAWVHASRRSHSGVSLLSVLRLLVVSGCRRRRRSGAVSVVFIFAPRIVVTSCFCLRYRRHRFSAGCSHAPVFLSGRHTTARASGRDGMRPPPAPPVSTCKGSTRWTTQCSTARSALTSKPSTSARRPTPRAATIRPARSEWLSSEGTSGAGVRGLGRRA